MIAVDTATAATVVGVAVGDQIVEKTHVDAKGHARFIGPLLRNAMSDSDTEPHRLELLVCGVGPGPFTGLRVGIATSMGFVAALGIQAVGVCSLDAIARAALDRFPASPAVTVVTKARRNEVFWACYDHTGLRTEGPLALPVDIAATRLHGLLAGDAVAQLCGVDDPRDSQVSHPSAAAFFAIVEERLRAGEKIPIDDGLDLILDDASASGASTEGELARRRAAGSYLLPLRPLYLRRPDAAPARAST